jgi:signal transduction histidine kinase
MSVSMQDEQADTKIRQGHEPILKNIYLRWVVIFALWLLIAAFFAAVGSQSAHETGQFASPADAFIQMLVYWLAWAIVSPLILRFARHFHWDRGERWRSLMAHVGLAAVIAPLQCWIYIGLRSLAGSAAVTTMAELKGMSFALQCLMNAVVYFVIVAVYNAFAYYHMYHRQKSATSELQARLAEAELAALKMQLQPHFLFNTLNAISVLMTEDVKKANQMLVRLSELLRLTMESSGRQQVSLRQELEFLECYLEIERIRFADRLQTHLDVEPSVLDALVPNLILQPLVENAIRHGIASRVQGGRLDVHARRRNGMLVLEIHDDGPGVGEVETESDPRGGIGLSNCRARLSQLYGEDHRFECGKSLEGGFSVVLTLPFRTGHSDSTRT